MKYLLLALLLSSCGSEPLDYVQGSFTYQPDDPRWVDDDPELKAFAEQVWDGEIGDIRIAFESIERPTIGRCYDWKWTSNRDQGYYKQIIIDPDWWAEESEVRRELLMLHELGHCVRDLDHSRTGIMAATLISEQEYLANKEEYQEELYN